jgi:hypothetical protein
MRIYVYLVSFLATAMLTACAEGDGEPAPQSMNFYEARFHSPAAKALATPGTNIEYAAILGCDQLAPELNSIARDMGQLAAQSAIYTNAPNNLGLAAFITKEYEYEHHKKELELNAKDLARMDLLVGEYKSLRYSAYNQQCPVTTLLDQAEHWANKEDNSGWRRLDRFGTFLEDIDSIRDEVKDW